MNHHSPEMFTNTYLRVSVSKEITYDSVISSVSSYNSRGFQVTLEPHTISLDDFKNLWQIFEKLFFSINDYDIVLSLLSDVNACDG